MRLDLPVRSRRRLIGLTPLIDVVFMLLLFFMLASSLTRLHSVPLEALGVARADTATPRALLLRIHAHGGLDINGEPVRALELNAALAPWLERWPGVEVIVQPADAVSLQTTLGVFDRLAESGAAVLRLR